MPLIILAGIVIGTIGVQSTLFKFEFIADKFDLSNEKYTYTNQARILAYTYPFELIYNDPSYVFRGAGRSDKKLREKSSDASKISWLRISLIVPCEELKRAIFTLGFFMAK